ncbi:act minimal PKS acyl carrier protein [Prauserella shujinwangii]|uniref:Act minimal PKS acyl carrier protein n=1 Tax=Prauserella shujinwangii TaxID=1453103 RepID=A0A2T0M3Z9_9PSEU|nr:acyl carrier protein [Prauserella shujinwangii]PRX51432.1 act minimal PKS acyl carrier protein [Prauserella shujinwangii]
MSQMTMDDLKRLLRQAAGDDEAVGVDEDITDTPFSDLGYDSLALLETTAHVKREFGVELDDEALATLTTPAEFLHAVNTSLATT